MVRTDEELQVVVAESTAWGITVVTEDGAEGFIDHLKIPSWLTHERLPEKNDSLKVVVLDEARRPFRASLISEDFKLARKARRSNVDPSDS